MTEERVAPWIVRQIEQINLWGLLAAALGIYSGYVTGTTAMGKDIEGLKSDVSELRADVKALTPRIDRLEVQTQLEREERMKGESK